MTQILNGTWYLFWWAMKYRNYFNFSYEFNEVSISQISDTQYRFSIRLSNSEIVFNRLSYKIEDSCLCDESVFESAVELIKASNITSYKDELERLYCTAWLDLAVWDLGPFLQLGYQNGEEVVAIPDKENDYRPPQITKKKKTLFPIVTWILHDLIILFFGCKNRDVSR